MCMFRILLKALVMELDKIVTFANRVRDLAVHYTKRSIESTGNRFTWRFSSPFALACSCSRRAVAQQ